MYGDNDYRTTSPDTGAEDENDNQGLAYNDPSPDSRDQYIREPQDYRPERNARPSSQPRSSRPQTRPQAHPQAHHNASSQQQQMQDKLQHAAVHQLTHAAANHYRQDSSDSGNQSSQQDPNQANYQQANEAYPQQGSQAYQQQGGQAAANTANGSSGSDFTNFIDKTGDKLEDHAEAHYEKKLTQSAYRAEDGVLEQTDRVYGCMENAIARWWNSLFEKKEPEPQPHQQHHAAPQTAQVLSASAISVYLCLVPGLVSGAFAGVSGRSGLVVRRDAMILASVEEDTRVTLVDTALPAVVSGPAASSTAVLAFALSNATASEDPAQAAQTNDTASTAKTRAAIVAGAAAGGGTALLILLVVLGYFATTWWRRWQEEKMLRAVTSPRAEYTVDPEDAAECWSERSGTHRLSSLMAYQPDSFHGSGWSDISHHAGVSSAAAGPSPRTRAGGANASRVDLRYCSIPKFHLRRQGPFDRPSVFV
ncbi:hypothetical protein BD309DRAFT_993131 [Dichomitus squalens]|nr:hypothetical protein BD309DRAFT_993131 [Dichomitus squalens]